MNDKLRTAVFFPVCILNILLFATFFAYAQGGGNGGRNRAPRVTSTPRAEAVIGSEYRYQVQAQDADGDTLRFRLRIAPQGMIIDSTRGLITWTPAANDEGFKRIVVVISDGSDETTHMFTITVRRMSLTVQAGHSMDSECECGTRLLESITSLIVKSIPQTNHSEIPS